MIQWALRSIADGELDKVVLARKVALELESALDPFDVLHHLKAATPGCFHFAISPAEGPTFLGASPERLFRQRGRSVESEAVAGTGERGDTPEADAALWKELLNSPKERREHAFVQRAIREVLDGLCSSVEVPDTPSDLALTRGRHLHARVSGTLSSDVSTADLLDQLHPTPAVGGVPTEDALTAIRTQEPFDRGWYAGPVGWVGPDAAEFAVAIRSGLVQDAALTLFSGAGIVDGSVPAREWEEIEQKIGDFAVVMGLGHHVKDPG
jgi:menaquinone-specific isochorismate synthase